MALPGLPTLIEPQDSATIYDSQPSFVFTIPTDTDNNNLHFKLQIDIVNTFDSGNLRAYESINSSLGIYNQFIWNQSIYSASSIGDYSLWEYFDGANWQNMGSIGVP